MRHAKKRKGWKDVKCTKRVFEDVRVSDRVQGPIAKIRLTVCNDWSVCSITTLLLSTDDFNHYHCPFPGCKKKFRKKYKMRTHLVCFHHGPFYCPLVDCGKIFNSKISKLRHARKSGHLEQDNSESGDLESYHCKQIMNF